MFTLKPIAKIWREEVLPINDADNKAAAEEQMLKERH